MCVLLSLATSTAFCFNCNGTYDNKYTKKCNKYWVTTHETMPCLTHTGCTHLINLPSTHVNKMTQMWTVQQLTMFWKSVRQTLLPLLSWDSEPGFCVEIITTYGNSQRGQEASWMCLWGRATLQWPGRWKRHMYLQPNSVGVWVCVQHCRPGRLYRQKGRERFHPTPPSCSHLQTFAFIPCWSEQTHWPDNCMKGNAYSPDKDKPLSAVCLW